MENKEIKLKILLIGKSGVGKSSVMWAFTLGHPDTSTSPTIGTDFQLKKVKVNGENIFLGIWDTAGLEMFKALTPHYYRDAHGAILVYDVTDPSSLSNLNGWIEDLHTYSTKSNVVGLVLGNKIDQPRKVTTEEGENFAKRHRMMFMESSAKTLEGINEAFEELTRKILETPGLWEYVTSNKNIKLDNQSQPSQGLLVYKTNWKQEFSLKIQYALNFKSKCV